MQAKTLTLALAALSALATGCASSAHGRPIPRDHVSSIQRGVTTTAQVQQLFGDPDSRAVAADGRETWTYSYEDRTDSRAERTVCSALVFVRYLILPLGGACNPGHTEQNLLLDFDAQQVVASFSFASRDVSLEHYAGRGLRREPPTVPVIDQADVRLASDTR